MSPVNNQINYCRECLNAVAVGNYLYNSINHSIKCNKFKAK